MGRRWERVLIILGWLVAAAVAALMVRERYRGALAGEPGIDFRSFLAAAQHVREGGSPFEEARYVYSPLLALLMAPLAGLSAGELWGSWTIASEVALLLSSAIALLSLRVRAHWMPWTFTAAVVSLFHFWPTSMMMYLGQVDAFLLLAFSVAGLAVSRRMASTLGLAIGAATALKTWPIATAAFIARRGAGGRRREEAVGLAVVVIAVAAVTVAALGAGGLVDWAERTLDKSSQPDLYSRSVWGFPRLLFEGADGTSPLIQSRPLQVVATAVLAALVVGLLVMVLRSQASDSVLGWWTVVVGVVLLLPISQLAYRIFLVPLVWVVAAEAVRRRRPAAVTAMIMGAVWWFLTQELQPARGSSWTLFAVQFAADVGFFILAAVALDRSPRPVPSPGAARWRTARSAT